MGKWPVHYPSQVWTYAGPVVPDLLLFSEAKRYMWVLFLGHNLHIIKCANSSEFLHMYTFYICNHHMSQMGHFPSLRELPGLQVSSCPALISVSYLSGLELPRNAILQRVYFWLLLFGVRHTRLSVLHIHSFSVPNSIKHHDLFTHILVEECLDRFYLLAGVGTAAVTLHIDVSCSGRVRSLLLRVYRRRSGISGP